MFILSINEPHWLEPIVTKVSSVTETIEHRRRISRHGDYLEIARYLEITYPDNEPKERFRLFNLATYTVELDPNYIPGPIPN